MNRRQRGGIFFLVDPAGSIYYYKEAGCGKINKKEMLSGPPQAPLRRPDRRSSQHCRGMGAVASKFMLKVVNMRHCTLVQCQDFQVKKCSPLKKHTHTRTARSLPWQIPGNPWIFMKFRRICQGGTLGVGVWVCFFSGLQKTRFFHLKVLCDLPEYL